MFFDVFGMFVFLIICFGMFGFFGFFLNLICFVVVFYVFLMFLGFFIKRIVFETNCFRAVCSHDAGENGICLLIIVPTGWI